MEKIISASAAGDCFIQKDQINLIHELKDLCYFPNVKQRKDFLEQVANSAGVSDIRFIKKEDFGTAYLTAKAILHKVGEDVFKTANRGNVYGE